MGRSFLYKGIGKTFVCKYFHAIEQCAAGS